MYARLELKRQFKPNAFVSIDRNAYLPTDARKRNSISALRKSFDDEVMISFNNFNKLLLIIMCSIFIMLCMSSFRG